MGGVGRPVPKVLQFFKFNGKQGAQLMRSNY